MKNFKKLTAAVAATLMAATMVAPMAMNSFAVEITDTWTAESGLEESQWSAYVEWAATVESAEEATPAKYQEYLTSQSTPTFDGKTFNLAKPANIDTITNVSAYKIFNLQAEVGGGYYTPDTTWANDVIKTAVCSVVGDKTPQEAMAEIAKMSDDSNEAKALAKAIANAIATATTGKPDAVAGSWVDGKFTFTGTDAPANGYYIFLATGTKNNETGTDDDETTESLGMLTIINGENANVGSTGEAKIGLPKVEKKVFEDDTDNVATDASTYETDKHWNDVADLEIGQEAKFRLYGTLPQNYNDYDSYKYVFHDTLNKGFEAVSANNITVKYYANVAAAKADADGTDGTAISTITTKTAAQDSSTKVQTITVGWDDLKTAVPDLTKDSVIVVEYTTKLTNDAVVATTGGQENKVNLEYSNNPNNGGSGSTEETPDDKVIVYTYDLEIDKTFFAGSDLTQEEVKNETYGDFKFKINKKVRAVTDADTELVEKYDYVVVDDSNTESEMTLKVYEGNTQVDTSDKNWYDSSKTYSLKIKIKGLDSDVYVIKEDQSARAAETDRQQYNDITDKNVEIISKEKTAEDETPIYVQDGASFADLSVKLDIDGEEASMVNIQNRAGKDLPSTGGMGTKLFYLGGGAMVAVAGIFLITKKRMKKEEV